MYVCLTLQEVVRVAMFDISAAASLLHCSNAPPSLPYSIDITSVGHDDAPRYLKGVFVIHIVTICKLIGGP